MKDVMCGQAQVFEPFTDHTLGDPAVNGFLHRPAGSSRHGLVLTHGAGGNCKVPLLVALASAFAAEGVTVLRCDLPYRQARPKGPPSPARAARDRQGLKHALFAIRRITTGPAIVAGHSYGGRQASMLLAGEPELAAALLLLSYPLHPPGRAELRTAHFHDLRTPTFFVHGSADGFGSLEEIEAARRLVAAPTALLAVEGARHDLYRGRPSPAAAQQTAERIAREFLAWMAAR
ncbi:MAG TPA: alpha/beta fold hydrolase [Methylomirabilota bacterium]|nr:alpha/beta fold hydrolase [Methylomirabilota bacterium]